MKLTRLTKSVLSLTVATTVAAASIAVPVAPKKAEAASTYKAYLCFMSKSYNGVANNHDADRNGVQNGNDKKKISGISVKDASFKKGKVNFTVSATGKNLKKFAKDKGWNVIYVDTNLPGTQKKKLSVSKVTLKMDGKTVKTISKPYLTPDAGKEAKENTQVMVVNMWNPNAEKKCKAASIKTMPKKSISITVTGKLK